VAFLDAGNGSGWDLLQVELIVDGTCSRQGSLWMGPAPGRAHCSWDLLQAGLLPKLDWMDRHRGSHALRQRSKHSRSSADDRHSSSEFEQ
jgi:hypothetical protein